MLEQQQTISFSDYSSLYDLIIPKDNLLRQITDLVDFRFVYQELQDKYCHDNGRTAESPIRMFKYLLLKVIYDISDVDVVERTRYDMSFKYFLGLTPEETNLINPSSLTKFRRLRLKDMDLLDLLIKKTVSIAIEAGVLKSRTIIVDATHTHSRSNPISAAKSLEYYCKAVIKVVNSVDDSMELPELPKEKKYSSIMTAAKTIVATVEADAATANMPAVKERLNMLKETISDAETRGVITGFPGAEGKGRIFIFDNCFAINSQSTHKEEAWKFVESYFTEEGQKTIAPNWNFSILQDVLDQQLSDSRKQEYYQTSDGKREKLPILTYEIGSTYENVYAAQDEDIQDVREMINNTKVMQRSDLPLIGITQAEALYYFNGEKSIEETAAAIRNKIDEMPNAKNAQPDMDVIINIGDFSVSLYEGEQEILGKLDEMGLLYEKVEDSDNKKYNYYYNVGDGEVQFIQVYFLEKECVRIRISSNETFAHTSRGIYSGNSYSQMVDQYGDSYEKHTYIGKERYTIYRYALGECFHEFGIPGEATGEIYNVDVYVSGQMPIYDYGEEIVED